MKSHKILLRILCGLVIIGFSAVTLWDFSTQLQRTLARETYEMLSEVSADYNKAFLNRISYNIKTLNVLSDGLAEMDNLPVKTIQQVLQNAVDDGDFSKIAVCSLKGGSFSNTGNVANVGHRDYFQTAIAGKANVSQPLVSMVDGSKTLVIAVPVHRNGEITGALFGIYPLATAGAQLLDFTYYSEGYGFVVAPDGEMILSSEHTDKLADTDNLLSFFAQTQMVDYSMEQLKADIAAKKSSNFEFNYQGEHRFVTFTPSTVNDWYTFSVASDKLMLQQQQVTKQIVFHLVLKLALVGILISAWVMLGSRRHNREILLASKKYQSLLDHINGGMVVATQSNSIEDTLITYVSPGFTTMTGYTLEDLQTLYDGQYLQVLLEEDRQPSFDMHAEQIANGNTYRIPYRIRKKDGDILWVMDNGYLVEDGVGLRNHSIITDITTLKQQEEALRVSESRFSVAINASSGTLFEVDLKTQLYTHFENAERIFGVSADKLFDATRGFANLPFDEFVKAITQYFFHPDDCVRATAIMASLVQNKTASYEARLRRYDGSYLWARVDLSLLTDEFGVPSRLVGFMSDIDDIKKQSELLESQVQTDPMTGLYNKVATATLASKELAERPNNLHALIVLDIDNFKGINDTLGHAFGDVVLMEVSTKLAALFRSSDIVGRMGGDEFAILMHNVVDTSSVLKKAAELSGVFRQTYVGEKTDYKISCSMGIIMIDHNHDSFETLYRKADAALYQAKQNGKDQFVLYREEDATKYPIAYTRTNDEELENLKSSHNMEAQIFELLYTSKDFNVSINMALAAIGQQYHVSRVSIFENDNDNKTISNIYEWCNDGVSSAMDPNLHRPIVSGSESVFDRFDANGLFYCSDTRELSPYLRNILESKDILAALRVTIFNEERTCGFIGFDDCNEHRIWTSEEIESLSFLSKVLSVFLYKKKTEIALLENLSTRLKILDVLPDYVCVVNPETHTLVYANSKMQELLPTVLPGAFCFTTLRGGQDGPCPTCLIERIKRGDTENLFIASADKHLHLPVSAISINWTGGKKMVLLYGTETTFTP
ncbi:MAG: diguanylate cyclase [Oscillospiraceae bacterium]